MEAVAGRLSAALSEAVRGLHVADPPTLWRQAAARQAKVAAGGAQQPDLGAGTREVRELELFAPPQPT